MRRGYGWIFTHFNTADNCIPLTLYDKAVADTFGLSELLMRAPVLLAGIAALVLLPWLLRDAFGRGVSACFACLLAISPIEVYFSRYARPYAPAVLCAILAVIAFDRWRREGSARWGCAYVGSVVLGAWLLPVFLPFALAPLGLHLVSRRPQGGARTSILVAGVAAGVALLLGPPLVADFAALAARTSHPPEDLPPLVSIFSLFAGTGTPVLSFVAGTTGVLGIAARSRRGGSLATSLLAACACQILALVVVHPSGMQIALIGARYALPIQLVLLLLMALGLEHIDAFLRASWRFVPAHVVSALVIVALLVFGPLRQIHYRPNQWTNHPAFQGDYSPTASTWYAREIVGVRSLPPFYLQLARELPSRDAIVEVPWSFPWGRVDFPFYQRVHRHRMFVGFTAREGEPLPPGELPLGDSHFRFEHFVHLSELPRMRRLGVRYVVFHLAPPSRAAVAAPSRATDVESWIREYERSVGAPVHRDEELCVFELKPER